MPSGKSGCLRQCDIARAAGASRSYVSEVLRKLVSEGVVERVIEGGVVKYRVREPESFGGNNQTGDCVVERVEL